MARTALPKYAEGPDPKRERPGEMDHDRALRSPPPAIWVSPNATGDTIRREALRLASTLDLLGPS